MKSLTLYGYWFDLIGREAMLRPINNCPLIMLLAIIFLFKLMTQNLQNSYLQRYELKQQTQNSRSLGKAIPKGSSSPQVEVIQANSIGNTVGKLSERVDGIDVKLTNLINIVKLLQKYTTTKDDQYEKEKESCFGKGSMDQGTCNTHCTQMEIKVKEFDILTRQFKDELRNIERIKGSFTFAPQRQERQETDQESELPYLQEMQDRLRTEINKKMEICVKLITSNNEQRQAKVIADKLNEMSFNFNQLENECRRNKMMFEKEVDNLTLLIKENSTQVPNNYSRVTENQVNSKSPLKLPLQKSKSRNSKSDQSISKGKQNRSAVVVPVPKQTAKLREDQLRQALRKKKEHRQRLKVKNW